MICTGRDIVYLDPKNLGLINPETKNILGYLSIYNPNIKLKLYTPIDLLSLRKD